MPRPVSPRESASSAQVELLVRAHAAMVRRALRQLGVAPDALDDAVQDVFVVLVRRIADFDRERSMTNWLWGIAKGVASGYRRSARRRGRLHSALSATADAPKVCSRPGEVEARCGGPGQATWAVPLPRDARTVERSVAGRQAEQILETFLESLDDGKCAVFVLSEVEGCSGPEIARRLSLNVNTVYARLRAARKSFRQAVSGREVAGARPMFAGFVPTIGKPLSLAGAAAVATVLALPADGFDRPVADTPRLAGYNMIPDALAPVPSSAAEVEAPTQPVASTRRLRPRRAPLGATAFVEDEPVIGLASTYEGSVVETSETLADLSSVATGTVGAGQGLGRGDEPMLADLAVAALALSTPTTAPKTADTVQNDADADDAARVGDDGVTAVYEFFDEDVEGENLKDDGTVILHRPRGRHPSLITLRGHFNPELIRLATDV